MVRRAPALLGLCLTMGFALSLHAQDLPTIEKKTENMEKRDGYFPLYWEAKAGKMWLEIPRLDDDFLYVNSLPAGLGSNDIGLDRGQLGQDRVVRFARSGPKILLIQRNLRYRATSDNPLERKAVADAFAESVIWGFKAEAQTGNRILVDATSFVVRDVHGIIGRLRGSRQGTFRFDANRSAPYLEMTKGFPENTEMEARVTFVGDSPGNFVRQTAADPTSFTLRVRHSFVKLPSSGYQPRRFDPRSGYFAGTSYVDYATPISARKEQVFINRHRLEKRDPSAAVSEAVEPIVYYLDPGTPEPIRSALLDGARWWAEAFEAAGFRNGFRVEMLPDGADLMDVRYNVIQWVHRATRGWSYGSSVVDPRTGEIIKGHVTLGSLRVRQDYLLAEGLLAPYAGANANGMPSDAEDPMLQMALARLRQLSAHEVGHTIGLSHNFASSINNRASVMDYPAPYVTVGDDLIPDLSNAYAVGIGEWDKVAVRYGYAQFPAGTDEEEALDAILSDAAERDLLYITDSDARPQGGLHPYAHLWENGSDAVADLEREMLVRTAALRRFGMNNIREGMPVAYLEEVLVPLYLRHRYQVEGTVKWVAGMDYAYTIRGKAEQAPEPVGADQQRDALRALVDILSPEALKMPDAALDWIPPRPPGFGQHRELFGGHTGLAFDPYEPAEVVAAFTLGLILHPQRSARLGYQKHFNPDLPDLEEVLTYLLDTIWQSAVSNDAYAAELQRIVQRVYADELLNLAAQTNLSMAVRSAAHQHLRLLLDYLEENPGSRRDYETVTHRQMVADDIDRFLARLHQSAPSSTPAFVPPGSPIGQATMDWITRYEDRRARQTVLLNRLDEYLRACGHE